MLHFDKAASSLVCLQELFNGEDVRNMYYLKGILEQSKGSDAASKQAFFSDSYQTRFAMEQHPPDAKPIFDSAKEEFSKLNCPP